MRLQISSRLAIVALLDLAAQSGHHVSVGQIGEKYGVSSHHLAKVMHVLHRAGLVRAVRGVGGGYRFSANARRTTLLDVIRLFEDLRSDGIHADAASGGAEGRALRTVLDEIDDIVQATLGSITIATMLKIVERSRTEDRQRAAVER
jgi:Rrf2 family protein